MYRSGTRQRVHHGEGMKPAQAVGWNSAAAPRPRYPRASDDWRSSFIAGDTRAMMARRLLICLDRLDAGMTASVHKHLAAGNWRSDLDFTGTPADRIDATNRLLIS